MMPISNPLFWTFLHLIKEPTCQTSGLVSKLYLNLILKSFSQCTYAPVIKDTEHENLAQLKLKAADLGIFRNILAQIKV